MNWHSGNAHVRLWVPSQVNGARIFFNLRPVSVFWITPLPVNLSVSCQEHNKRLGGMSEEQQWRERSCTVMCDSGSNSVNVMVKQKTCYGFCGKHLHWHFRHKNRSAGSVFHPPDWFPQQFQAVCSLYTQTTNRAHIVFLKMN